MLTEKARFYQLKSFTFPVSLTKETLQSFEFIQKNQIVLMLGTVGSGKTQ